MVGGKALKNIYQTTAWGLMGQSEIKLKLIGVFEEQILKFC